MQKWKRVDREFETVRRFTDALDTDDARLSTVDAKRTTISLQRTDPTGTVALHQSISASFPTKDATVSTTAADTHRITELSFSKCSADTTAEAATNAHSLHEQSVSGDLSAYADLSTAAPAATTATGLYNVPDVIEPKHNTSLLAAHADRPKFSLERKSAGTNEVLYYIRYAIAKKFVFSRVS